MSGHIGEAPVIVGRLVFVRDDGSSEAVCWLRFREESDDAAGAYRVVKGGKLEPLDDVSCWGKWKAVAALVATEGGG